MRLNYLSESVSRAHVRSQESFPHDGSDFRDHDTMRKNAIFAAADASNRAKAIEIGRATRAPQEGTVGLLSTACRVGARPGLFKIYHFFSVVAFCDPDYSGVRPRIDKRPFAIQRGKCACCIAKGRLSIRGRTLE